jgi:hypothetical protein
MKILLVKRNHFDYKNALQKKGEAPEFSLLALDGSVSHANCCNGLVDPAFQASTA